MDWCAASGAKFNIEKTEVLPVGTMEHRTRVLDTRKLNVGHIDIIPNNIKILKDGELARVLGAYVGNKTSQIAVWTSVTEKIDTNLTRWEKGSPTQEGRRLIANMEVGGRTQYLTRVQGMPEEVLIKIQRRLSNFVWDGHKPSINIETLQAPIRVGGRKLLDLTWQQGMMPLNYGNTSDTVLWEQTARDGHMLRMRY